MTKSWVFSIAEGADKDTVRRKAPELVSLLEREKVDSLSFLEACESRMRRAAGLIPRMPKRVEDICYEFGIVQVSTLPSGWPNIMMLTSAKGAAVNPKASDIPL
jgi:hypothetical protein